MYRLESELDSVERCLEDWSFFAKEYTDESVLKNFGTVKLDGEDVQITNHVMESVVKLVKVARKAIRDNDDRQRDHQAEIRGLRNTIDKYTAWAHMSDERFAEELEQQIAWCAQADSEGETYGSSADTKVLAIARDRLRNR